jgi:hypothetical protein
VRGRPTTRRFRLLGAALAVAAITAAACGSDDGDASDRSATSASTTVTEPTATTSTTPSTPTTEEAIECPAVRVPPGAQSLTETPADVDGDGRPDMLRSFGTGERWHVQVELAVGGGSELAFDSFGGPVGIVGGADVDGDGADEVWARTGAGASTTIVALARFADCQLSWATMGPAGERAEVPVGGTVGTTSGLACTGEEPGQGGPPADLTTFTATLVGEGPEYEVAATPYDLVDGNLVAGAPSTTTVSAQNPEFARYQSFTCGDLSL